MLKVLSILILISWASLSFAEMIPQAGSFKDKRLTEVIYDSDEVIRLNTNYGIATSIVFHEDEQILSAAVGDGEAWEIEASDNVLFIKPIDYQPQTNLHVKTNLRLYLFVLDVVDTVDEEAVIFRITFKYPKYEKKKASQQIAMKQSQKKRSGVKKADKPIVIKFDPLSYFQKNRDWLNKKYFVKGSKTLKPAMVFDDGNHTYILMKQTQVRPAVYGIGADGKESLVNRRDKGNWIIVQGIYDRVNLRAEGTVLSIANDAFGKTNVTLKKNNVKRLLK